MPTRIREVALTMLAVAASVGAAVAEPPDRSALLGALDLSRYHREERPPQFGGDALDGSRLSLAALGGKVVLVTFWATWCPPCRDEMPGLETMHRDHAPSGLAVVGVNVREEAAAVRAWVTVLGLTFPTLLDRHGEILTSYGVIGLPTTFLIGRDGRAVALAVGPRDWRSPQARALIRALLAEPDERR